MHRWSRLRPQLEGAGFFVAAAAVLVAIAAFFVLAQLESPDLVIWTGRCVQATEQGGIAYYTVNGKPESVNDPNLPATAPTQVGTVCYDPAHPEEAMVLRPAAHLLEGALVLGPLFLAALVLAYGTIIRQLRYKDMDAALPWPVDRPGR